MPLRHALEFRSPTFAVDGGLRDDARARRRLRARRHRRQVAEGRAGDRATSMYVRLHGDKELYASGYTDDRARRVGGEVPRLGRPTGSTCSSTSTTTCKGFAPYDAMRLIDRLDGRSAR